MWEARRSCLSTRAHQLTSNLQDLPEADADTPFDAYVRIDARQLELIRSLEWLTFDISTYSEALTEANALARHFLSACAVCHFCKSLTLDLAATDMPHAARELMFQLPPDLLSTSAASARPSDASQVREYLDYSSLFDCLEKHTRWAEVWARKPRPK